MSGILKIILPICGTGHLLDPIMPGETLRTEPCHGLIVLDKPSGITSRQAVDVVKRLVRPAKTGHAGTLDPLASGVLVVCIGAATRLIEYVQRMPKRYTGTFLLGRSSPTEDVEGEISLLPDPPQPTPDAVRRAADRLTGEIMQRPPAFSALKVQGRRAYDLARAGHEVELQPRPITIHRIDVLHYDYPELTLDIACGSGTYVRSLGRDLAESLGTAAVMSALVRTEIGAFHVRDACPVERLEPQNLDRWLLPAARALASLPAIALSEEEAQRIANGLTIVRDSAALAKLSAGDELAAFGPQGKLMGIVAKRPDGGLRAVRNLPPP
ncbi:MAG TPA: tRNA pseudouridine(55) synthase TruB [Pirellulales bacterium]|nr:tRNA pseudouridine(55) synthase TruB [Pirellulales bacterium]